MLRVTGDQRQLLDAGRRSDQDVHFLDQVTSTAQRCLDQPELPCSDLIKEDNDDTAEEIINRLMISCWLGLTLCTVV